MGRSYDYATLTLWEADAGVDRELLHVAVVDPSDPAIADLEVLEQHLRSFPPPLGYHIMTNSLQEVASWWNGSWILHGLEVVRNSPTQATSVGNLFDRVAQLTEARFGIPVLGRGKLCSESESDFSSRLPLLLPHYEVIARRLEEELTPELFNRMGWRQFEQFIGELLTGLGYEVQLGPGSRDGGVDLRVIEHRDFGRSLILVQVKNWRKRIQVDAVRALYGTVQDEGATKGIVVASAGFTRGAIKFQRRNAFRLELAGPVEISEWLKKLRDSL